MNDHHEAEQDPRTGAADAAVHIDTGGASRLAWAREESVLRQKAQGALRAGRVPSAKPESMWGGPGSGVVCAICGKYVSGDQLGFDLEFVRGGAGEPVTRHMHIPCFAAWELECQSLLQGAADDGTIHSRDRHATHERRSE